MSNQNNLTLIEIIEQKKYKADGCDLYDLRIENPLGGSPIPMKLYAPNDNDAKELGGRVYLRIVSSIKTPLKREFGLDFTEFKDNKLGAIIPWRNPIIRRSVKNSIHAPSLRSKAIWQQITKAIKHKPEKSTSVDDQQSHISNLQKQQVYGCIAAIIAFVLCVLLVLHSIQIGNWAPGRILGVITCLSFGILTLLKNRYIGKLIVQHNDKEGEVK